MKLSNKLITVALILLVPALSAYDNGVAEQQNRDRTGSPTSDAHCGVSCHNDQVFNPNLTIELIPLGSDDPVTNFLAGETYELRFSITAGSGSPSVYGFQSTVIFDSNETNAGTFQNPGSNVQLEDVDGRHIVEHSIDSPSNVFTTEWVAPDNSTETVTVYASSVACNNNGANSGDGYAGATLTLSPVVTNVLEQDNFEFQIMIQNRQLTWNYEGVGQVQLRNNLGQIVQTYSTQTERSTDLWNLPKGMYFATLENGANTQTRKFFLN